MGGAGGKSSGPVRVMVVDDSSVVRGFLARFIEEEQGLVVAASVPNGEAALRVLDEASPDVVLLDLEMPVMDGLTTLPLLLERRPKLPVIIVSTRTRENAALAMRCLQMGASDCLGKPDAADLSSAAAFRRDLVLRIKALGGVALEEPAKPAPVLSCPVTPPKIASAPEALAVFSSTGGPMALMRFFAGLGADFPLPVFVTQHMPPAFTAILAENIGMATGISCAEAVDGEEVKNGHIHFAPGDYHMTAQSRGKARVIVLDRSPPVNFCRPSADPMLKSLAETYAGKVLAVVLTGMGADGLEGCRVVVTAGGEVLAQDAQSSIVWGMPGAVAAAGLCTEVLPPGDLAQAVLRRVKGGGA